MHAALLRSDPFPISEAAGHKQCAQIKHRRWYVSDMMPNTSRLNTPWTTKIRLGLRCSFLVGGDENPSDGGEGRSSPSKVTTSSSGQNLKQTHHLSLQGQSRCACSPQQAHSVSSVPMIRWSEVSRWLEKPFDRCYGYTKSHTLTFSPEAYPCGSPHRWCTCRRSMHPLPR